MGLARGEQPDVTQNVTHRHIERIIETPIFKDVTVERPVYKDVEVERPVFVPKHIEVQNVTVKQVDNVITVDKITYRNVDVQVPKFTDVEVPRPVFKPVEVEVIHHIPKNVYVDEIVKVQKVVVEEVKKIIEVPDVQYRTVYVDRPIYTDRIIVREKHRFTCAKCGHVHEEDKGVV